MTRSTSGRIRRWVGRTLPRFRQPIKFLLSSLLETLREFITDIPSFGQFIDGSLSYVTDSVETSLQQVVAVPYCVLVELDHGSIDIRTEMEFEGFSADSGGTSAAARSA
ncbi:hypothetical protein D8S78_24540 [Natrialba swarupiae]|nr:hypothetical protein [Natrialba swarupiae]